MNTQTLTQRRAIHAYTEAQRHASEIAARRTDAILDSIRENDACGCAECDEEPAVSPWVFWPVVVGCSGVLTLAAYEIARLLPLLWVLS